MENIQRINRSRLPGLADGMPVQCRDGEKLGKITDLGDDYFVVQKGFFFPRDFTLRYDDIQDIQDEKVILDLDRADVKDWKDEEFTGWSQVDEMNAGRMTAAPHPDFEERFNQRNAATSTDETKVPLREEELETHKNLRQTGTVTLRKIVHTELRHFTIPVMKEEVRIERAPVSGGESAGMEASAAGFEESGEPTIRVPIMEEEVTISKRPVVKEEVRVIKERHTEERDVSEEIKKEDIDIQEEGKVPKRKAG